MTNIRELDYVCEPSTISIKVEYIPQRAGNRIIFFIGATKAFENVYRAPATSDKDEFNAFVTYCCELFFNHSSESDFINAVAPKNYLKGKYVYDAIKKVRAKSGYTIWTR